MAKAGRPMGRLHQDDVRAKIQASQLINVLTDHALGVLEELSPTRIKAIEILLRKSLPDLSSIDLVHSGSIARPREMSEEDLERIASSGGN